MFEFGVKQARSFRGFTTEAVQDTDTHPPLRDRKTGNAPAGPLEGTQGRHAYILPNATRTSFLQGLSRKRKHPWFCDHPL